MSVPLASMPTAAPPRWCAACGTSAPTFGPGPNGRPDARCETCGALERHRFLAHVLRGFAPLMRSVRAIVDIAPQRQIAGVIRHLTSGRYVGLDLVPSELTDVAGDITRLPLADDSVDLLVCYHVLEHVPDDASAMQEIARVLSPEGFALVQVPWCPTDPTDEDPDAPVEERIRRFGQDDHVRYYGYDFELRLAEAGLVPTRFQPTDLMDHATIEREALVPREAVWFCRTTAGPAPLPSPPFPPSWSGAELGSVPGNERRVPPGARDGGPPPAGGTGADDAGRLEVRLSALRSLLDARQVELEQARARLDAAAMERRRVEELLTEQREATARYRRAAEQHRAAYQRLAQHPVVRLLVGLRRLARRLVARG